MKIGKPVFARMADADPDFVSSDCPDRRTQDHPGHRG